MVLLCDPSEFPRTAALYLSRKPSGLITDVDGTISQIARRPEDAVVAPEVVDLLRDLSRLLDVVAVVSGRSVERLHSMIGLDALTYVGNHGLETRNNGHSSVVPAARPFIPAVAATVRYLQENLTLEGVLLEDKGASASIHYRLAADKKAARTEILRILSSLSSAQGLRVLEGRMVIDLLPPISINKGAAVRRIVLSNGLAGVLYQGDDVTDLDALRELRVLRNAGLCDGLTVAVASSESPAELVYGADWTLYGVDSAISFLAATADYLREWSSVAPREFS